MIRPGRSPHGERGLKCATCHFTADKIASLPARGAWVEISDEIMKDFDLFVAPRTGSVG